MTDQTTGFAPGQFGDVRVLLLGHHRRAGREAVVEGDEPEFRRSPQDHFLADAAQMDAEHRTGIERVGDEVPVGHCVETVVEDRIEAEFDGGDGGIERQGRTGERPGAEHGHVGAATSVAETVDVSGESPSVSQEMMGQRDRLCLLQVGVAG